MNTTIARPWSNPGRVFCALQALQRVRPCPYTPQQLPAACVAFYGQQAAILRPRPAGRSIPQKQQTAVKAIRRPYTAFCALMAIPIFPHRKTAHSGPQTAQQSIKQPRPAPLWSRPGHYYLFRARESTAQRSVVWSYHAQRIPLQVTHCSISTAPAAAHPAIMTGQSLSAGLFGIVVSFIVAASKKSFHSSLTSKKFLK